MPDCVFGFRYQNLLAPLPKFLCRRNSWTALMWAAQNSFRFQGAGSWSFVVPGQLGWASVDCCPCRCMTASIILSRPPQSCRLWEMKSWQTGKKGGGIWSYGEPVSNTSPIIFVCQRVKNKKKIVNIRSVKGVNPVPLRQCSGAQASNLSCSGVSSVDCSERRIHRL